MLPWVPACAGTTSQSPNRSCTCFRQLWFFAFDKDDKTAAMVPQDAECYACHKKDGAVDTTFVQFYPTLLPVARAKSTAR